MKSRARIRAMREARKETGHGLNPTNAADGIQDRDGDGYTNVEEYLKSLAPAGSGSVTVNK